MTQKDLDAFLASAQQPRSGCGCSTCHHVAASVIKSFMEKKAAGETHVSLEYLREAYLLPVLKYEVQRTALYRHVRRCLKRNPMNGQPL